MPVTNDQLVDSLEDCMFRMPRSESSVTVLEIPGIRGRSTPISTPFTNLLGVKTPGIDVSDESIDEAIDVFRRRGQMFGWLIGPHSPPELAARLEEKKFTKAEEFAGLALTDLTRDIPVRDRIVVHEAGPEDEALFASLLSAAFGLPPEMVSFLCRILYFADTEIRARNYFAYREDVADPIGVASTIYSPGAPIVMLAGSAVLPAHRGAGAYHALVARRLRDAREDSMEAAVIQAVRSTSAPICRTLGFEEVCAQTLYAWSPPESQVSPVVGT